MREIDLGYSEEEAVAEAQRCLNCGLCSDCRLCEKACGPGAIVHDMRPQTEVLHVGAVIVTPGSEEIDPSLRGEYGHGRYANVLSSVQFERMLSASGPTEGTLVRPADGGPVRRVAFIQCVGSRDSACGNGYCSSVCCMSATKEAMVALEHDPEPRNRHLLHRRARLRQGVRPLRQPGAARARSPIPPCHSVARRRDAGLERPAPSILRRRRQRATGGLRPRRAVGRAEAGRRAPATLPERLGIDRNEFGFCETDRLTPVVSSRPGVFVAGAFQEPKDIPESVAQASAAAAAAMELLRDGRGTLVKRHEYPCGARRDGRGAAGGRVHLPLRP